MVKNKFWKLTWTFEQIGVHENPGKLHSHLKKIISSMSIVWDRVHDYSEEEKQDVEMNT